MDKIKRYIDCYVPITTCTLRCHYCYIVQHGLFANKVPELKYSVETVRRALSKERLGGTCLINFCAAGETLISKDLLEYVRAFLEEGHYVMVVTNATISKRFDEIVAFPPELLKRLFFKFSYHYLELKEKNLLDRFFSNIKKVRDAGCSFTLEVTPSDELIPFIDEMNKKSIEEIGAIPHITIARDERDPERLPILTNMNKEEYYKVWSKFKSAIFEYKMKIFEVKRTEFCYAGDWSFYLNLGTGMMTQCYKSLIKQNIFEDVEKPIKFCPIGNNCLEYHCYNGHSYIVLGDIPELDAPTYAELRNRICIDGSEWLRPEMKSFMSTKLCESNKEYTQSEKKMINRKQRIPFLRQRVRQTLIKLVKSKKNGL
ncbi:radical SAM protein [Bacteroides bouchesdurhonensis]|uniref:radical SAM protein n=1 Tax=Bacteroides bouchesdurhonensis TaxID=1841855 RepID=UPI00097FA655|nr:radical SAM protein [Bacteroides bouchesdurhonensis]